MYYMILIGVISYRLVLPPRRYPVYFNCDEYKFHPCLDLLISCTKMNGVFDKKFTGFLLKSHCFRGHLYTDNFSDVNPWNISFISYK